MEFPDDIWENIMSWFHSAYREPLHYIAFNSIEIYQEYKTKDNPVLHYDGEIRMIENTLYRYILDDYSFCCKVVLIDTGKWNPYMTRYSWLVVVLGIDREKGLKLWNHYYKYNKNLIDDYNVIVKSLHIPLSRLDNRANNTANNYLYGD